MLFKKLVLCTVVVALSFLCAKFSFAQAVPVYTPPPNKLGGAVAAGIVQTLVRRGFAANDPRIFQTVASVGARVAPLAAAAGGGSNWIAMLARLNPWFTGGVLVYQGVKWYFDQSGNVVSKVDGQTVSSLGVTNGQACFYTLSGGSGACASTPEEAILQYVLANTVYTDLTTITLTPDAVGTTAYVNGRRYIGSIAGHRAGDAVTIWPSIPTYPVYTGIATATCPAGEAALAGQCVPSKVDKYLPSTTVSPTQTMQTSYNNLPQIQKDAALKPDLAAEIANRLWRDAALQPGYSGVPFSANDPVVGNDFVPYQTDHAQDWPVTSTINAVVPTTGVSPIAPPESNPNQVSAPTTATKVDLGADPGVASPTLENTPTDLFKPIKDLLQPWLSWTVPSHSAQCPTWHAAPVISGHVFTIDVSQHCPLAEQYRSLIMAASLAAWIAVAAFIVLSA
jgi:hypothetical protein